jgi:hypothetical protein
MRIDILEDLAIISISEGYSVVDLGVVFDFYHGEINKEIRHFVFNCNAWKWVDSMGGELCILQGKSKNRKAHPIFCGVDDGIKNIINVLNEGSEFPEPIFLDTLEEGLSLVGKSLDTFTLDTASAPATFLRNSLYIWHSKKK